MSDWNNWDVLGTAGNNSDAPPDGFPEGMPYAAVNDAARELMAATARWWRDHNGSLVLTAANPNLTGTLNRTAASGAAGNDALRSFIAQVPLGWAGSSTPSTLAVNGLAPLPLVTQNGNPVTGGALTPGQTYLFVFVGGTWQVSGAIGVDIEISTINQASGNVIRSFGQVDIDEVLTVGAEGASDVPGSLETAAPLRVANFDQEVNPPTGAQLLNIALYHAGDEALLGRVGFLSPTNNAGAGTASTILALHNCIANGSINLYRNNGAVTPVAAFSSGVLATTLRNPNGATILDAGGAGSDITLARPVGTGTGNVVLLTSDGDTGLTVFGQAGDDLTINADVRNDVSAGDHTVTVGGTTLVDSTGPVQVDVAGNRVIDANTTDVRVNRPSGAPGIIVTNVDTTINNLRFNYPVGLLAVTFSTSPSIAFPLGANNRGQHVFVRDVTFAYSVPANSYATLDIADLIGTAFPIGETTDIFCGCQSSTPPPPVGSDLVPHLRLPGTASINGCQVFYTGPRPDALIRGTHIRVMKMESTRYLVHVLGEPLSW